MAGITLNGKLEKESPFFSIPTGLQIRSIDDRKFRIIGNSSDFKINFSYYGLDLILIRDQSGNLVIRFSYPCEIGGTTFLKINKAIDGHSLSFAQLASQTVEISQKAFTKKLIEGLLHNKRTSSYFPEPNSEKVKSNIDTGIGIGGFVLYPREYGETFRTVKGALGYDFKNQKFLSRMSIDGKMANFDGKKTYIEAVQPIITATKRIMRGDDPWANPFE